MSTEAHKLARSSIWPQKKPLKKKKAKTSIAALRSDIVVLERKLKSLSDWVHSGDTSHPTLSYRIKQGTEQE